MIDADTKPDYIEGLAREVEAAQAERKWRDEGSKGMHAPFHGDFAFAPPSVLARLSWWVRELRRERGERQAERDLLAAALSRIHAAALRQRARDPGWRFVVEELLQLDEAVAVARGLRR